MLKRCSKKYTKGEYSKLSDEAKARVDVCEYTVENAKRLREVVKGGKFITEYALGQKYMNAVNAVGITYQGNSDYKLTTATHMETDFDVVTYTIKMTPTK